MINTVLFDMDGLLINSEPFWRQAMKLTFAKVGIMLTEDLCRLTMGKKTIEVIQYWHGIQPWNGVDFITLENEMISKVQELVNEKGNAMPGVYTLLDFFKERKFKIGLASSSSERLINTVLHKLQVKSYFDAVHSAEHEAFGKPHPAVFLKAAEKLGASSKQCIVFEDSYNGMLAAQAAQMKTIVIPDYNSFSDADFATADLRLPSLSDFNEGHLTFLNTTAEP